MNHTSNTRIIRASKLLDRMNFSKDYDFTKIYDNSKKFESNQDDKNYISSIVNAQDTSFRPKNV